MIPARFSSVAHGVAAAQRVHTSVLNCRHPLGFASGQCWRINDCQAPVPAWGDHLANISAKSSPSSFSLAPLAAF